MPQDEFGRLRVGAAVGMSDIWIVLRLEKSGVM